MCVCVYVCERKGERGRDQYPWAHSIRTHIFLCWTILTLSNDTLGHWWVLWSHNIHIPLSWLWWWTNTATPALLAPLVRLTHWVRKLLASLGNSLLPQEEVTDSSYIYGPLTVDRRDPGLSPFWGYVLHGLEGGQQCKFLLWVGLYFSEALLTIWPALALPNLSQQRIWFGTIFRVSLSSIDTIKKDVKLVY